MSDAYSDTREQLTADTDDSQNITCRVCNQSGQLVVVHPWKDDPIFIDPAAKPPSRMFTVLSATNIKVQNKESYIYIRLFGDPVEDSGGILKKVELHLSTNTSLELLAEDLVQITLIKEVRKGDLGEVKCGDG